MAKGPHGEIYEAKDGFRWRLKAGNNKVIADGGESYNDERKALNGFDVATSGLFPVKLVDGTVMEPELEVTEGEKVSAGSFDGLPNDPNHPLYSPLTVDGNK